MQFNSYRPCVFLFLTALSIVTLDWFVPVLPKATLLRIPFTDSSTRRVVVPVSSLQLSTGHYDYAAAYADVYRPNNYSMCAAASEGCWPSLYKPVNCREVLKTYTEQLQRHVAVFPVPRDIPPHQLSAYTLGGLASVQLTYANQQDYSPDAAMPIWNETLVQSYMQQAQARKSPFGNYGGDVLGVYKALDCHPVKHKSGAVFGSNDPWLESILFAFGATKITTIEFRKTKSTVTNFNVITPLQWAQEMLDGTFQAVDFLASFSSFEHDGLGRYGDPLNPWGDVEAMQRASCFVKKNGLMFLAVPVLSIDQLVFNLHRIYGPVRLPLMTSNWQVLGVYSHDRDVLSCSSTCDGLWGHLRTFGAGSIYQPVIVLQNNNVLPCSNV